MRKYISCNFKKYMYFLFLGARGTLGEWQHLFNYLFIYLWSTWYLVLGANLVTLSLHAKHVIYHWVIATSNYFFEFLLKERNVLGLDSWNRYDEITRGYSVHIVLLFKR